MAKTDYKTIDQYHAAFDGDIQARMQSIRTIINKIASCEECISYQIPCFKYKGYLIYYAAFKKHISLSYPFSQLFWDTFKQELKGYKLSRAAIQFPNDKPLPERMIERIIEFRKKENDAKAGKRA